MSLEEPDRLSVQYRPEIDGLRAIAVMAVMLFHADVGVATGGYGGVDVFLVISGYLITGIIVRDVARGSFSFGRFYTRRALRIIPALLVLLLACLPAALLIADPRGTKTVGAAIAASMTFSSNVYFWRASTGYFAPAANSIPLIHLWSLSLEEQFYIIYPLFLFLAIRRSRTAAVMFVAVTVVASLIFSQIAVQNFSSAGYFLLPSRLWELAAGGLCALIQPSAREALGRVFAEIASLVGVAAIFLTFCLYTAATPFPGVNALPAVAGCALILLFANTRRPVGAILSARPLSALGLASYSAYLWHQPLLTFAQSLSIDHLPVGSRLLLLTSSFGIAGLMWRFVEQPFRRDPRLRTPRALVAGACTAVMLFACGAALWHVNGLPQRFSPRHLALIRLGENSTNRELTCLFTPRDTRLLKDACTLGRGGPITTAIMGDSHAMSIAPAFEATLNQRGERALLLTVTGCPPTLFVPDPGISLAHCVPFNRQAFAKVVGDRTVRNVIVAARWPLYLERLWPDNGEGGVESGFPLLPPSASNRRLTADSYREAVRRLLNAGKHVTIVYPMPEPGWDIPLTMAKREMWGVGQRPISVSAAWARSRASGAVAILDSIGIQPNLVRLYPAATLCSPDRLGRCVTSINGQPIYFDANHVTAFGAKYALPNASTAIAPAITR